MIIPEYIVGLDIGTNSCGYVATDLMNNLLHVHGKTTIGARLFKEGTTAADRRGFRTTRRRLKRRKWRLGLLQDIFETESSILKEDPYFFARMKESGISPRDSQKQYHSIVFRNKKQEKEFYNNYPTIYHLRNSLMTEDKQFSLTEIFIALHHIVKYRGNFLKAGEAIENYKAKKLDVVGFLDKLQKQFKNSDSQIQFDIDHANEIQQILVNTELFKTDKQKQIKNLLVRKVADKKQNKLYQDIAGEIAKAILVYKTRFEKIFSVEDVQAKADWEFKLDATDIDAKIDTLFTNIAPEQQEIFVTINELYSAVMLNSIVPAGMTLSQSMIKKYDDHKNDLATLKAVIHELDAKKGKKLQASYNQYIGNRHASSKNLKLIDKDEFYKQVKAIVKDVDTDDAKLIIERIEQDLFMPKQRTNQNGVIPNQIHQIELDKIIENQGKYYPFLKQANPVEAHQKQAPYKLDELLRFRVPYYVGPMVTSKVQHQTSGKDFAWMIRKANGPITPWNFEDKVDKDSSAEKFIKRMTTKDTYLFTEDVLPAASLLYQKFTVLNELNNIKINGNRLEPAVKMDIYENLFKNEKAATVSAKIFKNYWRENYYIDISKIDGMVDPTHFISKLESYHFLKKTLGSTVDEANKQQDLEKILEWATIFEDTEIYQRKLGTINWLTREQVTKLASKHFKGWGRLSKKLLTGIVDQNGQNIMQLLEDTKSNFQQVVTKADIQEKIAQINTKVITNADTDEVEDVLNDAYTSPANKKAIRQVIRVVDDIVKACHHQTPKQIAIEFAREPDAKKQGKLTKTRYKKLQAIYKKVANELANSKELNKQLENAKANNQLLKDKYYLYFTQFGRDAYTGIPIPIDQIHNYEIDHILPQSFIKDDSMSNRVLVAKAVNNSKSDNVPLKLYGQNVVSDEGITIKQLWKKWNDLGLITNKKYNNLLTDPDHVGKYQKMGFINRQLVETSQIIKLVATILQVKYPNTEIIVVKASSNHDLRKQFNLYKSREVNDYHHAIDAYLTTIVGNYLYQVYPKLRQLFVYGQYKRFRNDTETNKNMYKNVRLHDFLGALSNSKSDEIKDSYGNVKFSRKDIISKLKRAYEFKYMNISRETYISSGSLYDQTIYPNPERDSKTRSGLIAKQVGMPTEIYGGYSAKKDAYMSLIELDDGKKIQYKIVGVPVMALSQLKNLSGVKYMTKLKEILAQYVLFGKTGKRNKIKDFKILKAKLPYRQVISDREKHFMLGSSTYQYNAKQLTLSTKSMKCITNNLENDLDKSKALDEVYDEILAKVNKYLPLFDINKFREKLNSGREIFINLSADEKHNIILNILNGLHDNAVLTNLKDLGINTPFGQMQAPSGITLSKDAVLVYKSPTGLFEKRVKISEL